MDNKYSGWTRTQFLVRAWLHAEITYTRVNAIRPIPLGYAELFF